MKSIKLIYIAIVMIPLFWSCDFLDYSESDQYEKEDIFAEFIRVKSVLSSVYSYLPTDFSSVDGAMRSSASDDAEHEWDLSDIQKMNDGSWNSTTLVDDQLTLLYSAIRTANVFLEDAKGLTFSDIQYNDEYEDIMQAFAIYPYEAKFLRAFYYFALIKRYGDVPLVTTVLTSEEANNISPSSFEDVVNFIVTECDSAIAKLPATFSTFVSQETGRATKGAAMALKARTLLYAASPLHNPSNDVSKWIAAATAAKELMDQLGSNYTPLPNYKYAVNYLLASRELILERREPASNSFEAANTAIGFIGGNTGTCPTQNLVDAYEMAATGLGINEAGSGYDPANPYAGRDPRFELTILHNGSTWKSQTVETWNGGLNAPPKANATKTGYYLRKYMIEGVSLDPVIPSKSIHTWVIFRYSEVLLNYAEAMNEAYGPEVTGPDPLIMTARDAVNIIRSRNGLNILNYPTGMTQADFRTKLRNERRVELAFEDHRFWDIRRWKIGDTTKDIYGITISKDNSGMLTYTKKRVETRNWNDRMNLYPIPQAELYINKNLVQNSGW